MASDQPPHAAKTARAGATSCAIFLPLVTSQEPDTRAAAVSPPPELDEGATLQPRSVARALHALVTRDGRAADRCAVAIAGFAVVVLGLASLWGIAGPIGSGHDAALA